MKPNLPSPGQLVLFLLGADLVLAVLYFASLHHGGLGVHQLIDLDQEANIPVWFSSLKFFCIAAVLGLYGPTALGRIGVPRVLPILGAAVFLFLSMDETAQIHERLGRALRGTDLVPTVRGDRGGWVFVYLMAVLPLLYHAVKELPKLWRSYRTLAVAGVGGCALIALGAVGVELVADHFLRGYEAVEYKYKLSVLAEETLEALGASLLLLSACCLTQPASAPVREWHPVEIAKA